MALQPIPYAPVTARQGVLDCFTQRIINLSTGRLDPIPDEVRWRTSKVEFRVRGAIVKASSILLPQEGVQTEYSKKARNGRFSFGAAEDRASVAL